MTPIDFQTHKRRRELVHAGAHVFRPPGEHPATTLKRDAAELQPSTLAAYVSAWNCPDCHTPNLLTWARCCHCERDRSAARDPR